MNPNTNFSCLYATGRDMRPTEHLRFLERIYDNGDGTSVRVRVLQQQWAPVFGGQCEWRDVPLVTENESPA